MNVAKEFKHSLWRLCWSFSKILKILQLKMYASQFKMILKKTQNNNQQQQQQKNNLLSWKLHLCTLGEAFWWWCFSLCLSFSPSLMWGDITLAGDREIFCGLDEFMCFTGVHLLELSRTGRSSLSLLCPAVREMYLTSKQTLTF